MTRFSGDSWYGAGLPGRGGKSKLGTWSLTMLRWFVDAYRLQTLPIAERYFRDAKSDEIVETSLFGYRLPLQVARSNPHRLLCLQRERFIAERYLLFDLLTPGDTVVDVGANIGYYLLLFQSRVGSRGRVVCIEPDPTNLEELRRCIQVNRFDNVHILEAAIGDTRGTARIREGLNSRVLVGSTNGLAIPMITLDELVDRNPKLVKIDIEGFEGQALCGGQELMKTLAPNLFIEVHPRLLEYGYSVSDVIDLVRPNYKEILFHKPGTAGSIIQKLNTRYQPGGGTEMIRSETALLEACRSGRIVDPFWMICKN